MDNEYFYNQTIQKYIKIFGALFSNYKVYHGTKEIRVPIVYGNKSKMYIEKEQNYEDERPGEILLPVMSYRLNSIDLDIERKLQPVKLYDNSAENDIDYIQMPKPFDLNFDLYVWVKYENDMHQLLEQILFNFSPKTILSVNIFPDMTYRWDITLLLTDNADETEEFEYDQSNTLKQMKWRFGFTIKGYLFSDITKENLIKIVTANYKGYDDEGEIDDDKILQEEVYEVNPFESLEDDDYNIKLTKVAGDKTYVTFIEK